MTDDRAKFEALTDERILMIGRRALDKCYGTDAQHIYLAREVERVLTSAQAASVEPVATWDRLAAAGRVDTLPFRVPGTMRTEKVECVILTRSDVAGLAAAPDAAPQPDAPAAMTDEQINALIRAQTFWGVAAKETGLSFGPELHSFARDVLALATRAPEDEQRAFDAFVSKQGIAANYLGDGQYQTPGVQLAYEAWLERAARSAHTPEPAAVTNEQIKYVPVDSRLRDANWRHPNDDEPCPPGCREALDQRGDDEGQGLDGYWKWGFKAGWNACAALATRTPEPAAVTEALPGELLALACWLDAQVLHWQAVRGLPDDDEEVRALRKWARMIRAASPTPEPQAERIADMSQPRSKFLLKLEEAEALSPEARAKLEDIVEAAYRKLKEQPPEPQADSRGQAREGFQRRVEPWLLACFGEEIAADRTERSHRFIEEALELVQACGTTASEAHQLVDYVYGRPVGEAHQEVGGVMVTLAALCRAHALDMHEAGETELARIWTKVEQIRAKQAAKPKHSPLPAAASPTPDEQRAQTAQEGVDWKLTDKQCDDAIREAGFAFVGPRDAAMLRGLCRAAIRAALAGRSQ